MQEYPEEMEYICKKDKVNQHGESGKVNIKQQ